MAGRKRRIILDSEESDSESDVILFPSKRRTARILRDDDEEYVAAPPSIQGDAVHPLVSTLFTEGVVTVPCIPLDELAAIREEFLHVTRTLPELRRDRQEEDIVPAIGGFGALGLPSSFHHPFIRHLRTRVYNRMVPFFRLITRAHPGFGIEQLIDRVQLRQPGTQTTPESFHRDTSVYGPGCSGADGDLMFGGWLNLDLAPQYFSCVKGTHKPGMNDGRGFSAITNKAELAEYKAHAERVEVPPGGVIVFFSNIVHEVLPRKRTYISARQYHGWRLTPSTQPLFLDLDDRLDRQDKIQLPSAQEPPMYAALHWTNHAAKLAAWCAENLDPGVLADREIQSGARKGEVYKVVPRFLQQPVGVLYYAPYTPEERSKHKPRVFP